MKRQVCAVILRLIYRVLNVLYKYDSRVKKEIDRYEPGYTLKLAAGMKPNAPALAVQATGNGIRRIDPKTVCDIEITMKNMEVSFLIFTGRMGIATAYAQHRFYVRGNTNEVMYLLRCIEILEAYLFPRVMTKRIMKEVPEKQRTSLAIYSHTVLGV